MPPPDGVPPTAGGRVLRLLTGGRLRPQKRQRARRRLNPTELRLRSFVLWGVAGSFGFPLAALAVGWMAYTRPGAVSEQRWDLFWDWAASHRWAAGQIDVLTLLATTALTLFLATQVGSAVSGTRDDSSAAQTVGLEVLTSLVCAGAAIMAWMAFPGLAADSGSHPLGVAVGVSVPLLCTWLSAFIRPSPESIDLVRARATSQFDDLDRLLMGFRSELPAHPDGRPIGSGARDGRWIRRSLSVEALLVGVVAVCGIHLVAFLTDGWNASVTNVALASAGLGAMSALVYVGCAVQLSELYVSRLLDSRWVTGLFLVFVMAELMLLALVAVGMWRGAGAVGGVLFAIVFAMPGCLAVLRRLSPVMQARAYREVRRRAVNVWRLRRRGGTSLVTLGGTSL